jgi:ribonuclease R
MIEHLRGRDAAATLVDLVRAFGLGSAARRSLKDMLNELVRARLVERLRGDRYRAVPADGGEAQRAQHREGRPPERRFANSRESRDLPRTIVGVYTGGSQGGVLSPVDRRIRQAPIVRPADRNGALAGELVRGELVENARQYVPHVRIVARLGRPEGPRAISDIAIHQQGIPVDFDARALQEARAARAAGVHGRADLRSIPLVTIDGPDARDFDDAVYAEPVTAATNRGGWKIVVAIADVAHYVRPGTALDNAARERGNSVYFPDRVVPMLPHELSDDLCSLRPGQDRACLAAHLLISSSGELLAERFERALIRSAARLTYEQVQAAQDGNGNEVPSKLTQTVIRALYGAFAALAAARRERHALELDLPERKVRIDEHGKVTRVEMVPRLDSHRLIEEFMILANVAAAQHLERRRQPCMYRVHESPDPAKLEALRPVFRDLGLSLPPENVRARDFNRILRDVSGKPHERLVGELVLRSQSQAAYSPINAGHFGLALRRYAHFTSPIRRYSDLLVHRAIIGPTASDGVGPGDARNWQETGEHLSRSERRAMSAERDALDRYLAVFLSDKAGAEFDATISGVTRFGLFLSLTETGADGFVPIARLAGGGYRHDAGRHTLATRGGAGYALGDRVTARLARADVLTGSLLFDLVEHQPVRSRSVAGLRTKVDQKGKRRRG